MIRTDVQSIFFNLLPSVPYGVGVNYTTIARQARDQIRSTFLDSLALLCSVPLDILELYEGLLLSS